MARKKRRINLFAQIGRPIFRLFYWLLDLLTQVQFPQFKLPKIRLTVIIPSLALVTLFYLAVLKDLPSPKDLVRRNLAVSTKIYDRKGILLYKIYKDQNRSLITLSEVPLVVIQATLAAEDAEFYSHPGFSVRGIFRALINNLKESSLTGGSTITQQLVKNALLTPEKTLTRKLKELILAIEVEMVFTKDQILEMYLNEVPYGGTAYGITEAAKTYFSKEVQDLSLAEAALLAGLPKSPTKFSPLGQNPGLAIERQREVLSLMRINKYLTPEEESKAKNDQLTFSSKRTDIKAPHFVMYVREQLEEIFGKEMVAAGGLQVTTTLDYQTQQLAETSVGNEIAKLANLKVTNGGALVLNPQNGDILAMVGSKDYFDLKTQGNVNVTTSLQQPGSAIKIINYAYALAHGFTPASIVSDTPISFPQANGKAYTPQNYDGTFRGNLSLRQALAQSRNIPAVRVLNTYGVAKMVELGQQMGITTWSDPSQYGLSLTLGGGDVKLLDLARVYATVANYGTRPEIVSILKVTNYQSKELPVTLQSESQKVIGPGVAFILTDILKDNPARSPAFGLNSQLVIKGHPEVAVKTGTSNNLRDNLTVGYNQNFLVAVWVGNNDNSPMSRVASGVTGASPIFNQIMTGILKNQTSTDWEVPKEVVKLNICPLTGTLACGGCGGKYEWFLTDTAPTKHCNPAVLPGQILDNAASISN